MNAGFLNKKVEVENFNYQSKQQIAIQSVASLTNINPTTSDTDKKVQTIVGKVSKIQNSALENIRKEIVDREKKEAEKKRVQEEAEASRRRQAFAAQQERKTLASPKLVPTQPSVSTNPTLIAGTVDYETYIRQKCSEYGCNPAELIHVMYCESGGRANAINPAGPYIGLFQFLTSTFNANARYIPQANIYDPYHQIDVTAKMFANGQRGQWGCKYRG
jgi:hypothetical protein